MSRSFKGFVAVLVLSLFSLASANKERITDKNHERCTGMYNKHTWGGKVNPFISFNLNSFSSEDVSLAVVVFEYQDVDLVGKMMSTGDKAYICDDSTVGMNLCTEDQIGTFIIGDTTSNKSQILTYNVNSKGLSDKKYYVKNTGYYCVATYPLDDSSSYKGIVNFRNSFGNIPAAEFPKLPLYGALAIAYAVTFAYYGFNFWKHKHEVLPLQKYFLFFFVFLTIETVLIWSYYDLENRSGNLDAGVKVYMVFISLLNSFKFSFSFFLMLVIALGYGIVYPKLDRRLMLKCQLFTLLHFAFAAFFIISNYLSNTEDQSVLAGISAIPISIVTAAYYVVVLTSLSKTTALLLNQRQMIKLNMYKKLFRIIFLSLLVLILGVIVSSFIFIGMSTTELVEQHWKSRFFFLDFWPSLVYYVIFNLIAFIWRPTDSSYMLAASSQLPTDPENAADFELDDLQSLDDGTQNGGHSEGQYNHLNDNDSLHLDSDEEDDARTQAGASTLHKNSDSFDDDRTVFDVDKSYKKKD